MGFLQELKQYPVHYLEKRLLEANHNSILQSLGKTKPDINDFISLLSPAASPLLEEMAKRASALTRTHFGRQILLFTPLYLSNFCNNQCLYCSFNTKNSIERSKLDLDDVEKQAMAIAGTGIRQILVLTGDSRQKAGIGYLQDCCTILQKYFPSIAIEIFALDSRGYSKLIENGVNSLTIYQETYNEKLYATLHPRGPKSDYHFRLDAPEMGAKAGMHSINIGTLLGLDDWRRDVFFTGLHGRWLQRKHPEVELSISVPRIRPHVGKFGYVREVSDREMVQIMTALRIFLPRCGITVSTRESGSFRDNILPLGLTKMSADAVTSVGGRTPGRESVAQFEISDKRDVESVCTMLMDKGFQPVFKDWF